jgi:hypothetical protein
LLKSKLLPTFGTFHNRQNRLDSTGKSTWNYWSITTEPAATKTVCAFADLEPRWAGPHAARLRMGYDGLMVETRRCAELHSFLGVKPLIWYISGGDHIGKFTPKRSHVDHQNREEEIYKIENVGFTRESRPSSKAKNRT